MLFYRCLFLEQSGRIATRLEFRAKDDVEAMEFARELYALHSDAGGTRYGFELWHHSRLVGEEVRNSESANATAHPA
jgi:hypothetical protein